METPKAENDNENVDAISNSSGSDELIGSSVPQNKKKTELNYGDIVIMIWKRVKMNIKIGDKL